MKKKIITLSEYPWVLKIKKKVNKWVGRDQRALTFIYLKKNPQK